MAPTTITSATGEEGPGAATESHPVECHAVVPWAGDCASDSTTPDHDPDSTTDPDQAGPDEELQIVHGTEILDPEDELEDCVVMLYDVGLDEDDETSLTTSTRLHLMSEHHLPGALHLAEEEALLMHRREHATRPQNHAITDFRFRPARALAGMYLRQQREAAAALVPQQHSRV